ncbi:MAG: ABC transporter ATP-binding protein [Methanomassiliicoccus sp.]|nr:ABC transporter ATP-binding protein [Methanomassiliicoccus sp.]
MPPGAAQPIVIRDLTKQFSGFLAVDSLSLMVERNTFLGFLGPNGAGKTTAIKILTNLLDASSGEAYLNGVDVTKDPKTALAGVGAVVETPEFYPYLTPTQTLMYLGRLRGMPREKIIERSGELLHLVLLTEWADKRIGKFSKGMKQRLALAQALLHRPHVLILDEPTSGLDPRGMVEVRNILKELKKENYTVFMSSHLLNEVQEVCDHVAIIDHGKLLASGEVSELLRDEGCRMLEVRFPRPADDAALRRIGQLSGVVEVERLSPEVVMVKLKGREEEQADLLDDIRELGLKVSSFTESGNPLEALYMSLIKESR